MGPPWSAALRRARVRYTRQMSENAGRRRGELFEDFPGPVKGWIVAHCDGGSRGNPGPSGFGVLIEDKSGAVLAELSEFLGRRTNNYAEYAALLAALNFAVENGHPRLRVIADSELMVKQIQGQYRVNSPDLKPLHEEARHRIARLEGFEIQHVLREKNRRADELANLAMDRGARGGAERSTPGTAQPDRPHSSAQAQDQPRLPIPIVRLDSVPTAAAAKQNRVRGFVKGGVVHLLDGAQFPDGTFVTVHSSE